MSIIDYRQIAESLEKQKRRRRGNGNLIEMEVPFEERIAASVQAELSGDRGHIIGAIGRAQPLGAGRRTVPPSWTLVHVMDRLEEAWLVLSRLPVATRPRGYANAMPAYVYDRFDLNAQMETHELEKLLRMKNRVRLPPSPDEISRMDEAFSWIGRYLSGAEQHHLARAVNVGTRWTRITERDCKRLRAPRRTILRRKMQGLQIILWGLLVDRAPIS